MSTDYEKAFYEKELADKNSIINSQKKTIEKLLLSLMYLLDLPDYFSVKADAMRNNVTLENVNETMREITGKDAPDV